MWGLGCAGPWSEAVRRLGVAEFEQFFREVHGREQAPFPWQTDLLQKIVNERAWPEVIDLPTGSGKTTCIDIAVFALAMDALGAAPWCPRRIVMVVDRRVVVDQAARRARAIARALRSPQRGSVTSQVASALSRLSCDGNPLKTAVLRGGIPRDRSWARSPDEPLVLASTVDQVGSRLLFRGYGVSASMAPVHAGLLGNDALILLDEVHLSRPFQQTVETLAIIRGDRGQRGAIHVVSLSATPGATRTPPFRLSSKDRKERLLADRLGATKPARLTECAGRDGLVDEAAKLASELLDRGHRTVAVVVNRVKSAHEVARKLLALHPAESEVNLVLLTGRMRALDRDDLVWAIEPRVGAISGRRRGTQGNPLVVVATQCIEAGADFDFDALVTEHASLDALRQRFGRVDRLGEYKRAEGVVIAVLEEDDKGKLVVPKDDPVYGDALARCWATLQKLRGKKGQAVDFGVDALDAKLKAVEDVTALLAPKSRAPAFFPAYLDLWAQTAPLSRGAAELRSRVVVEPDLPAFLHGPQAGPADVQIVWRLDLDDAGVWDSGDDADPPALARVDALPPTSLEAVSVPFGIARNWLAGKTGFGLLADVERSLEEGRPEERLHPSASDLHAIVWRGDASLILRGSTLAHLRPGDTIVVPASCGGLFMGSFDPASGNAPAIDIAERANLLARGKPVLRLHTAIVGSLGLRIDANGDVQAPAEPAPWLLALVNGIVTAARVIVDDQLTLLRGRRRLDLDFIGEEAGEDETTDDEVSSFTGRPVRLQEHSRHVEQRARRFGEKLGLAPPLVGALSLAGWLHDIGKADPRFQRLLRDGSEITLLKDQERDPYGWQLAKSAMGPDERRRRREASRKSGYPRGARHEVLSLAMIENALEEVRRAAARYRVDDEEVGLDFDLVLYLVASHHGWCRPFPPAIDDPAEDLIVNLRHGDMELQSRARHGLERLDGGCVDRFFALGRRYGWHRLAWFEAILRLADHRASEAEGENGGT